MSDNHHRIASKCAACKTGGRVDFSKIVEHHPNSLSRDGLTFNQEIARSISCSMGQAYNMSYRFGGR